MFTDIPGNVVADLTGSGSFPDAPSSAALLTSVVETPANAADNYGQRLRALLAPPVSGNYTFWIAADETAALLLGTNASPASARQIASVTAIRADDQGPADGVLRPVQQGDDGKRGLSS